MLEDAVKWNKKYKQKMGGPSSPDDFFFSKKHLLTGQTVLDLAGGDGKNSFFLASQNFDVTLLDISIEATTKVDQLSLLKGLNISTITMDLDDFANFESLPSYDNIIISYFKPSIQLFRLLPTKLNSNGRIFLHTFAIDQHINHGFSRRFCLEEDEYLHASNHLQILEHSIFEQSNNFIESYVFQKNS